MGRDDPERHLTPLLRVIKSASLLYNIGIPSGQSHALTRPKNQKVMLPHRLLHILFSPSHPCHALIHTDTNKIVIK